jgi:hypothetical protein
MCEISRTCNNSQSEKCLDQSAQWLVRCVVKPSSRMNFRFVFMSRTARTRAGRLPGPPRTNGEHCCTRHRTSWWIRALKSSFDAERRAESNELLRVPTAAIAGESVTYHSRKLPMSATRKDFTCSGTSPASVKLKVGIRTV